jgi:hypothetical protein
MFEVGEVNLSNSLEEVIRCLKDFSFKAPIEEMQAESIKLLINIAQTIREKPEVITNTL